MTINDQPLKNTNEITELEESFVANFLNNENNSNFTEETMEFLKEIFVKANFTEEQRKVFLEEFNKFQEKVLLKENEEKQEDENRVIEIMKRHWGKDFTKNHTLANRGLKWLNLINLEEENEEKIIIFINKIADLGKMISEDSSFSGGKEDFLLSKTEARKMREAITNDKNFAEVIFNKKSPLRQELLEKLSHLNYIIASGK